jgi:hypothetical protein
MERSPEEGLCHSRQSLAMNAGWDTELLALAWTVLSHGTVTGWAECKGIEVAKAAGQVVQGLERLQAHYGS